MANNLSSFYRMLPVSLFGSGPAEFGSGPAEFGSGPAGLGYYKQEVAIVNWWTKIISNKLIFR